MNKSLISLVNGRKGHFQMESGHHGDLWYQLETLCLHSREIRTFAGRLAVQFEQYEAEVVCGPLVEGAFVALLVSIEVGCQFAYAERFADPARKGLYAVEYRVAKALEAAVKGKRVAIVNDVILAGSAVRGTYFDLWELGAQIVAIGALLPWALQSSSLRPSSASLLNCWRRWQIICGHHRDVPFVPPAYHSKS
jgi:orotate phosphoribosyltransferase